ncbi:hypothetical protein BDZ89DRAFT_226507 [Hymenopellis radicata]|nr:hypothetical protein BDZ89DRAFT_226507 [Hymenopellis radicata]
MDTPLSSNFKYFARRFLSMQVAPSSITKPSPGSLSPLDSGPYCQWRLQQYRDVLSVHKKRFHWEGWEDVKNGWTLVFN